MALEQCLGTVSGVQPSTGSSAPLAAPLPWVPALALGTVSAAALTAAAAWAEAAMQSILCGNGAVITTPNVFYGGC